MKRTLLNLALTLSMFGVTLPAVAQPNPSSQQQPVQQVEPQAAVIPQTAGIIITFPGAVAFDAGQKQDYPLTLPLSQAILDSHGNVLVPENTPVSIKLKSVKGGAQIVAESIVVGGQIVQIQASAAVIPGTTITQRRATDSARDMGSVFGKLGGSVMGFMGGGDPDRFDRGAMAGGALGMLSGLRSAERVRVVQIPQGSVYVLSLQASVTLPPGVVQTAQVKSH